MFRFRPNALFRALAVVCLALAMGLPLASAMGAQTGPWQARTSSGLTPGAGPVGIAAGADGAVWFTLMSRNAIGRVTPDGAVTVFSPAFRNGLGPYSIAAGPDGAMWYAASGGDEAESESVVARITPGGEVTEYSSESPASGPSGITSGPDGAMWFTQMSSGRIGRITPDGTITGYPAGDWRGRAPDAIAAGPDGNLWFTALSGRIGRMSPGGRVTGFTAGLSAKTPPRDIIAGPDGALWFVISGGDSIGRITTDGEVTTFPLGLGKKSVVGGLAAGPDGAIWFTDFEGDRVGRMTPQGVVSLFGAGITPGSFPAYLTPGAGNALWFTEFGGSRVARITTEGAVTEFPPPAIMGGVRLAGSSAVTVEVRCPPGAAVPCTGRVVLRMQQGEGGPVRAGVGNRMELAPGAKEIARVPLWRAARIRLARLGRLALWVQFASSQRLVELRAAGPPPVSPDVAELDPRVAVAPTGEAVIAWRQESGTLLYADVDRRGRAGRVEVLGSGAGQRLAFGADGTTIAAWSAERTTRGSGMKTAVRSPGRRFGKGRWVPGSLGGELAFVGDIRLAVAPSGSAVMVWQRNALEDFAVLATTRPAGGAFGPARVVSGSAGGSGGRVAIGPSGAAVVVWEQPSGTSADAPSVMLATVGADGVIGRPIRVGSGSSPDVAALPDGRLVIAWVRREPGGESSAVVAATRSPGGWLTTPVRLSRPGAPDPPLLAAAATGALAAYWREPDGRRERVVVAVCHGTGEFARPIVAAGSGDIGDTSMRIAGDGTVTLLWSVREGKLGLIRVTTVRPGASRARAPITLSRGIEPRLAVGTDGAAVAVWSRGTRPDLGFLQLSVRPPGRGFGPSVPLFRPPVLPRIRGTAQVGRVLRCTLRNRSVTGPVRWLRITEDGYVRLGARTPNYRARTTDRGSALSCVAAPSALPGAAPVESPASPIVR